MGGLPNESTFCLVMEPNFIAIRASTKFALKLAAIILYCVCIGIQAYVLLILLMEIAAMGHTGVASAFAYGAGLSFSLPAYLIATGLVMGTRIKMATKWIHSCYLGSHLVILACTLAIPGQFT